MNLLRQRFIDERCGSGCGQDGRSWVEGFTPRESVEPVRNCTQLERGLAEYVINLVALKLLETTSLVCCCPHGNGCQLAQGTSEGVESDKDGKLSQLQDGRSEGSQEKDGAMMVECPHQWNEGGEGGWEGGFSGGEGVFREVELVELKKGYVGRWN